MAQLVPGHDDLYGQGMTTWIGHHRRRPVSVVLISHRNDFDGPVPRFMPRSPIRRPDHAVMRGQNAPRQPVRVAVRGCKRPPRPPASQGRLPGNSGGATVTDVSWGHRGPTSGLSRGINAGCFLGDGLRPWEVGGRGDPYLGFAGSCATGAKPWAMASLASSCVDGPLPHEKNMHGSTIAQLRSKPSKANRSGNAFQVDVRKRVGSQNRRRSVSSRMKSHFPKSWPRTAYRRSG